MLNRLFYVGVLVELKWLFFKIVLEIFIKNFLCKLMFDLYFVYVCCVFNVILGYNF